MKRLLWFIIMPAMAIVLMGCPTGLDYPLGTPGKEKIDERLLGTWFVDDVEEAVQEVKISKKDDYTYDVEVVEQGAMYGLDTDKLTGYVTTLGGKTFVYFKPDNEDKYYHYMVVSIDGQEIKVCDMSLLDGGVDAVTSSASLREQVSKSMERSEFTESLVIWYRVML